MSASRTYLGLLVTLLLFPKYSGPSGLGLDSHHHPKFSVLFASSTIVSPYLWPCCLQFQVPAVICGPEAGDPPDKLSEGQYEPHIVSLCLYHSHHFLSSPRYFIISHHHKKGECSTIRYLKRERDHIHVTLITVDHYNCSILLLIMVVHLFLCHIHNFIIGVYVWEKQCLYDSVPPVVSVIHWGSGSTPRR